MDECCVVSPPKLYVEILISNAIVLGAGDFRRLLGHEGTALINRVNAPIKAPESSLIPFTMWKQSKGMAVYIYTKQRENKVGREPEN